MQVTHVPVLVAFENEFTYGEVFIFVSKWPSEHLSSKGADGAGGGASFFLAHKPHKSYFLPWPRHVSQWKNFAQGPGPQTTSAQSAHELQLCSLVPVV